MSAIIRAWAADSPSLSMSFNPQVVHQRIQLIVKDRVLIPLAKTLAKLARLFPFQIGATFGARTGVETAILMTELRNTLQYHDLKMIDRDESVVYKLVHLISTIPRLGIMAAQYHGPEFQ